MADGSHSRKSQHWRALAAKYRRLALQAAASPARRSYEDLAGDCERLAAEIDAAARLALELRSGPGPEER